MKIVPAETKTQLDVLFIADNVSFVRSNTTELKELIILKELTSNSEKFFLVSQSSKIELTKQLLCVKYSNNAYAIIQKIEFMSLVFNQLPENIQVFENLMKEKTSFNEKINEGGQLKQDENLETSEEKPLIVKIGDVVSDGIEVSSGFVASTVKGTSELVGSGLVGAKNLYTHYTPKNENYQVQLPEVVKETANEGEYVTKQLNQASSELMTTVVSGLSTVAKEIYNVGANVVSSIVGEDENSQPNEYKVTAFKIGEKTINGIANILGSVGYSIDRVVNDASETSSGILGHSIGKDVGDLSKKSISMTKNATETYLTLSGLNTRRVVLSTALKTADDIVKQ